MIAILLAALAAQAEPPKMPLPPKWRGPGGAEFEQASQLWMLCRMYEVTKHALAQDRPEKIVAAASKTCSDDEKLFKKALLGAFPEAPQSTRDGLFDMMSEGIGKGLLEAIDQLRATRSSAEKPKT